MCGRSYKCWRREGLTLIEVLAATALLGVLLAGIVLAQARHTRQLAEAQRRQAAVREAERLLVRWWDQAEGLPRRGSGVTRGMTPGAERMRWRTRTRQTAEAERLGAEVLRLEVRRAVSEQSSEPLVVVELLVPPLKDEETPGIERREEPMDR